MHYYTDVLKKYAVFSGRARRQEFWMFVLCNLVVDVVLVTLDVVLGTSGIIDGVYTLAVLLPWVGLTVHAAARHRPVRLVVPARPDPLLGWIWLIVLMATEGEAGPNKYGPSPKAIHA